MGNVLLYAPVAYVSLSDLSSQLSGLRTASSYGLAKRMQTGASPLATRAVAKIIRIHDRDTSGSIDEVAQLEFSGLRQGDGLLGVHQEWFYSAGLGRISLVPEGGMSHNFADVVEKSYISLTNGHAIVGAITKEYEGQEALTEAEAETVARQLAELEEQLYALTDVRARDGFTKYENIAYGMLFSALAYGSQWYRQRTERLQRDAITRPGPDLCTSFKTFLLLQFSKDQKGPNLPIQREVIAANGIHGHGGVLAWS